MCCSKGPHAHIIALGIFAQGLTAGLARADEKPPAAPPLPAPPPAASTEEVRVTAAEAPPEASHVTVGQAELDMRPRLRAEEVLESAPGLFTVQHSGGAKAQQYFLRGFDADHGTDIAFSLDGVPLNAVSHAHGQGYTDLHFLIPETLRSVDVTKGPYSPRFGDFATAGAVELHLVDSVPEGLARLEIGEHGRARGVVVASPELGDAWRAVYATELFTEDGPFIHPDRDHRASGLVRVTRLFDDAELSLTWMAYGASWNASGELPARAVCGEPEAQPGAACISRWGSFDPTQGGDSYRSMLAASGAIHLRDVELSATAYAVRSTLQLYLDETFLADDPVHGGGIEQVDGRTVLGGRVEVRYPARALGMDLVTAAGAEVRSDSIDEGLFGQMKRVRWDTKLASHTDETELGAFAEEDVRPLPWLRFVAGGRADLVGVTVHDAAAVAEEHASGTRSAGLLSPKAAVVVSASPALDVFADYGRGFHSNDARGVVQGGTLLAVATGYEVGARVRPLKHLELSATAFLLDLTSELVFDGDDATTTPAGRTRREGVEIYGRYHFGADVFADAAFTATHARFRDDDGTGTYVPLAPPVTFAAGIEARHPIGGFAPFGSIRVRSIADRPATQDGSLTAQGFTLVDLAAGLRWKNLEAALDVINALDATWREGQFAITSRLPGESRPVTGMSFTPGTPRDVMGRLSVHF